MAKGFTTQRSIVLAVPAARVWEALTRPEIVKQYMFGTNMSADWRVGGSITYAGEWEGKPYVDKGTILELKPGRLLSSTYLSSMSGKEDKPENYNTVTYSLSEKDGKTTLTVTQDNNPTQESAEHSAANWGQVLEAMRKIVEA